MQFGVCASVVQIQFPSEPINGVLCQGQQKEGKFGGNQKKKQDTYMRYCEKVNKKNKYAGNL